MIELKQSSQKVVLEKEVEKGWKLEKRFGGAMLLVRIQNGVREQKKIGYIKKGALVSFQIEGKSYFFEENQKSFDSTIEGSFESKITSHFPGKIIKIFKKKGDLVEKDEPILSMEAMKMEFQMSSSVVCKIKKIFVSEGDQVTPKQLLVELEELT